MGKNIGRPNVHHEARNKMKFALWGGKPEAEGGIGGRPLKRIKSRREKKGQDLCRGTSFQVNSPQTKVREADGESKR